MYNCDKEVFDTLLFTEFSIEPIKKIFQ
jgi:transposase